MFTVPTTTTKILKYRLSFSLKHLIEILYNSIRSYGGLLLLGSPNMVDRWLQRLSMVNYIVTAIQGLYTSTVHLG
jgi:hypothetical protein